MGKAIDVALRDFSGATMARRLQPIVEGFVAQLLGGVANLNLAADGFEISAGKGQLSAPATLTSQSNKGTR